MQFIWRGISSINWIAKDVDPRQTHSSFQLGGKATCSLFTPLPKGIIIINWVFVLKDILKYSMLDNYDVEIDNASNNHGKVITIIDESFQRFIQNYERLMINHRFPPTINDTDKTARKKVAKEVIEHFLSGLQ